VGPAGLPNSKEVKDLPLNETLGIPDVSLCLSQPFVPTKDYKKPNFEPLEHSIYFGRRRLGRYVRVARSLYAAYDEKGRLVGRFRNRKKAWAAISKVAAAAGRSGKPRRRSAPRPENAVPKRYHIVPAKGDGSEGGVQ
jgi:hypothetical protein